MGDLNPIAVAEARFDRAPEGRPEAVEPLHDGIERRPFPPSHEILPSQRAIGHRGIEARTNADLKVVGADLRVDLTDERKCREDEDDPDEQSHTSPVGCFRRRDLSALLLGRPRRLGG